MIMLSQKSQLMTKVNDKEHVFQCDPSASLAEVLQALDFFRSYVYGRIKEDEDKKKEEPKAE